MAGLTVLDASVLLAYFDARDTHSDAAVAILKEADALAASVLTLAETLVGAHAAGRLQEQLDALADLQIRPHPIGDADAAGLARLRSETGLRMPDCFVLHAAERLHADAIATRDRALAETARTRGYQTP